MVKYSKLSENIVSCGKYTGTCRKNTVSCDKKVGNCRKKLNFVLKIQEIE